MFTVCQKTLVSLLALYVVYSTYTVYVGMCLCIHIATRYSLFCHHCLFFVLIVVFDFKWPRHVVQVFCQTTTTPKLIVERLNLCVYIIFSSAAYSWPYSRCTGYITGYFFVFHIQIRHTYPVYIFLKVQFLRSSSIAVVGNGYSECGFLFFIWIKQEKNVYVYVM